jgi:hypothetical protein
MTIYHAAADAYRGIRDLEMQYGRHVLRAQPIDFAIFGLRSSPGQVGFL